MINATHAVILAEELKQFVGNITVLEYDISVQKIIPDNYASGIISTIEIPELIIVEHVEVTVDILHTRRGDLEIELSGSTGTRSFLTTLHNDIGHNYPNWTLMSMAHWDEPSIGAWSLTVKDSRLSHEGWWNSWKLRIWGTKIKT